MVETNILFRRVPNADTAVQAAQQLKSTVDPIGQLDRITIYVGASLHAATLLLLIYAFFNRKYAPIRAKNILLTGLVLFAGIMVFVGDIATNGHVELVGVWSKCKVWCLWFRVFFAYTFSAAIGIRTYALYRVFVQHQPYRGFGFYVPIIGMFALVLAFCLTTQFISDEKTVKYVPELEFCTYVWAFRGACLGLLWVIWLVVFYFVFMIRNITSSFNERIESIVCCILALTIILFTTLMHTLHPEYPLNQSYRVANTFIDFCMCNVVIVVILGYPCFQCIFNRERYLEDWTAKLRADGLKKEYKVSTNTRSNTYPYAAMDDGDDEFQKSPAFWAARASSCQSIRTGTGWARMLNLQLAA
ncbi:hypothetical protein DL89DRAFT_269027, partial [Linderina pennispora]